MTPPPPFCAPPVGYASLRAAKRGSSPYSGGILFDVAPGPLPSVA